MRIKRLGSLAIALVVVYSFIIGNVVSADDTFENLIDADFNITFNSGTQIEIEIVMNVEKITTDITYTSSEISVATDDELGAITYELYQMLNRQLNSMFPDAEISDFRRPVYDSNDELFKEDVNISLTNDFFNLNETVNVYDFVNGVLGMGAIIDYNLSLEAEPGWNNTYYIYLNSDLGFQYTTGSLSGSGRRWDAQNWNSEHDGSLAEFQIQKTDSLVSDDIYIEFELDSRDVDYTSLKTNIIARIIDIQDYNIVPDFIQDLNYITADGIRLFEENGFIDWNESILEITINPIKNIITEALVNSTFNQTLDFEFSWDDQTTFSCEDPYNISNMDYAPAVKGILTDEKVDLEIFDISNKALFGLINTGAISNISEEDINFGDNLQDIGHNYNITLYMPPEITIEEENVYTWNATIPLIGNFYSNIATTYSDYDIENIVEIDIQTTDLNLLSVFTGNSELIFGIDMNEECNYNATKVPNQFTLPEKVDLEYLCADAFRLCVNQGVFSNNQITTFLNDKKTDFENRIKSLLTGLEITATPDKETFDDSISEWNGDIADMDTSPPVKTSSNAHSSYPLRFDLGFIPPKFDIPVRTYNFTGIENQSVTYKIYFPNGISIDITNDTLNKGQIKETDDGRYYLEISFDSSEGNVSALISCKLVPSAFFIISIMMPCIISFIITIILLIVVLIIRRKHRGTGKKLFKPKEEEVEDLGGYEEEEYYVPPPPGSK